MYLVRYISLILVHRLSTSIRLYSSLVAATSEDKGDSEVNGGIFIEGIDTHEEKALGRGD